MCNTKGVSLPVGKIRSITDYVGQIYDHMAEGRDWSPVRHMDLCAWQRKMVALQDEAWELSLEIEQREEKQKEKEEIANAN